MRIAITGHRPNKLGNDYDLTSPLILAIRARIIEIIMEQIYIAREDPGKIKLITGMALGIDTLFAQIAISLNIPFIAAIPCRGQSQVWPQKAKETYLDLINHPLCTREYISLGLYNPQAMQARNQWMIHECDVLIAVWDGSKGGTCNCYAYAVIKNKQIIRINPKEI